MIATAGPVVVMAREELTALIAAAADAAIERYAKAHPNAGKLRRPTPKVSGLSAAKVRCTVELEGWLIRRWN